LSRAVQDASGEASYIDARRQYNPILYDSQERVAPVPLWLEFCVNLWAYVLVVGVAGAALVPLCLAFWPRRNPSAPAPVRAGFSGSTVLLAFLVYVLGPSIVRDAFEQFGVYRLLFPEPPAPSLMRKSIWAAPLATLFTAGLLYVVTIRSTPIGLAP